MDRLEWVNQRDVEEKLNKLFVLGIGAHSELPGGWQAIAADEVNNTPFFVYNATHIDHRHVRYEGNWIRVVLFFFHDGTGLGIGSEGQYYRFGCDHTYRSVSQNECRERGIYHGGNCYHVSECTKCHYINSVDSSD